MASGNLFGNPCSSGIGGVSDFYTKDQINSLLLTKANTSTTYTRSYLDSEFSSIEGSLNSLNSSKISLTELNAGLENLETEVLNTVSGLYALKTETYTKSEVDSLIDAIDLDPNTYIRVTPESSEQNTIYPDTNDATPLTLRGSSVNPFVQKWISNNTDLIGYISNTGSISFERDLTLGALISENGIALDLQMKRLSNLADPQLEVDAVPYKFMQDYIKCLLENLPPPPLAGYADEAGQAVKLKTPRNINGVPFDGTSNITISARPSHSVYKTIYVSPEGNNGSTGRNEDRPVASIEKAIEIIQNQANPVGWTVKLMGNISTPGEIEVPDYTTIMSTNMQRRSIVSPTGDTEKNVFLCGNGVHIYGIKFTGWTIDDFDNPTKGFGMAFRPGAIILPGGVPYGQNCVVTSSVTEVPTPLPMDAANGNPAHPKGGGCVLADASVLSGYTVFPNIMTWGFTPSSHNGMGYVAKNRGFINPVNAIGVGAHRHFMCIDGGQMVVSGSSSQFGDYSFWSEGSTQQIIPLKVDPSEIASQANAATVINALKTSLIDDMWDYLLLNFSGLDWTGDYETFTKKDAGLFLDAIAASLVHGFERPMLNFAEGLFNFNGVCVYTYNYHNAFKSSWDWLENALISSSQFNNSAESFISASVDRLKSTMDNYWFEVEEGPEPLVVEPVRRKLRSLITAINHQWTAPMSGVEFYKVPPAKAARRIQRSIVQKNGGRVRFSGQDDAGNAVFVGGLVIDSRSGQLGGPPFDSAIRGRVTRAIISRSY